MGGAGRYQCKCDSYDQDQGGGADNIEIPPPYFGHDLHNGMQNYGENFRYKKQGYGMVITVNIPDVLLILHFIEYLYVDRNCILRHDILCLQDISVLEIILETFDFRLEKPEFSGTNLAP